MSKIDGAPDISVVIITVGRPMLYELLAGIEKQEVDFDYEVVLVANGPEPLDSGRLPGNTRVLREAPGMGFSYYRNRGTDFSRGRVVVFVDDDELPRDERWLELIASPVLGAEETATTGGAIIPQGAGYLADLISMLGFPGGGSLGWRNVWPVDESGHTWKLCTCNCAISKDVLERLGGFHEGLVYGAEDVYMSELLLESGVMTRFIEESAVYHEPRGDLVGFLRWQVRRGRSVYNLRSIQRMRSGHVSGRLERTWIILKRTWGTRQFPGMLAVIFFEFACQLYGYAAEWVNDLMDAGP